MVFFKNWLSKIREQLIFKQIKSFYLYKKLTMQYVLIKKSKLTNFIVYQFNKQVLPISQIVIIIRIQIIRMNRNYYQGSEIDCACFDFRSRTMSLQDLNPNTQERVSLGGIPQIKPLKSLNLSASTKMFPKKSLKRKTLNQSCREAKYEQPITKEVAIQTLTQRSKIQNNNCCEDKDKQNRSIQYKQQPCNYQNIINKQQLAKHKTHQKSNSAPIQNLGKISIMDYPCLQTNKTFSINDLQKSFKKKSAPYDDKQNKKKCYVQPSDVGSYEKTIKRRISMLPNKLLRNVEPTTTSRLVEEQMKMPNENPANWKRVSIRPQGIVLPTPNLKSIHPKQIQSFDEQDSSLSGYESEVLERGRFTWAPQSTKLFGNTRFVSTLHIREENEFAKVHTGGGKMVMTDMQKH